MNKEYLNSDFEHTIGMLSSAEKEAFKGSTILLTGCAGFLGFYFLHLFQYVGEAWGIKKVIALDNFMLGEPKWIEEIRSDDRFCVKRFDIIKDDVAAIEEASRADYVIHMASIASPVFYRKHPIETLDANIWGLRRLLDFYCDKHLKGLLFFSSSELYGDPDAAHIPTDEEYRGNVSATGPRACYDESKRFGETMCMLFAAQYGMPIGVVRPFNNYGPGMKINDMRVPADFASAVIENKDIVILSDGSPTRTFCYIADAIAGYLKALVYGSYDYFNIGIEAPEISIAELAEIYKDAARELCGYTGSVVKQTSLETAYLTHNPQRRCPNISKARRLLGYNPTITAADGVRRYLEFLLNLKADEMTW